MALRPKDTRPHVIVVEDEQFQRETLTDFLDENGYRASGVESGAALRKLVEKDPPALVLLDLRLPGGDDGFSLARFLRERSRKMGIIMLTASGDTVDQVVGLETGADDYIAKPYEPRALLARMKAVLRRAGGAHAATPGERVRVGKCLLDLAARRMTARKCRCAPASSSC
jgi:DNA-binding response OmpR family regulator